MANEFLDAITASGETGKPLVWLDAEFYGSRVLLQGKPFPWTSPTEFVSSYAQLQSLLKPDVAPLQLGRFLQAWLQANPAALTEMSGKKRIRFALKRLLGMEAQRHVIQEIVAALCSSLSQPVMLVLPPNGDLINWANNKANSAEPAQIGEIDIDSVSVYLADFLRAFSGLGVAGVLIQLPPGCAIDPELLDLYSPIINVAKHYHWAFGMQSSGTLSVQDPEAKLQFVIADSAQDKPTGIVLPDDFWETGRRPSLDRHFVYADIPPKLKPEAVLESLAILRG